MLIYVFLCRVSAVPIWLAFDDDTDGYIEPKEIDDIEVICVQNDSIQYIQFLCYLFLCSLSSTACLLLLTRFIIFRFTCSFLQFPSMPIGKTSELKKSFLSKS